MTQNQLDVPPPQRMFQLVTGYWVSQIVGTLAKLGVADFLADGPRTIGVLAERCAARPGALARILRGAAAIGVVAAVPEGYALTPLGETLRSGVAGSMRDFAIAETSAGHWLPWGRLDEVARSGERATPAALGMEIWEWYDRHPPEAAAFGGAMANLATLVADDVAAVGALRDLTIVDIGAAHGALVAALLDAEPTARGVAIDLPHVAAAARRELERFGARAHVVAGDFFSEVPAGDVYVLKQILHDWNDDECRAILTSCARSARPGARLLIVEMVVPDDAGPHPAKFMDVNMLVMLTGRERTAAEYEKLFSASGWRLARVAPAHAGFSVLEAVAGA